MARTAPAPDLPPIPGMCPSVAVLAGGGDGGGGSGGSAGDGSGNESAGTGKGGEDAASDSKGAPDPAKYPDCGTASHPVDVVTGRAFTHPIVDLSFKGPLTLELARAYSSKMAHRDTGMGFGWGHTLGWEVEVGRRQITVWNDQGVGVDFAKLRQGDEIIGPWGWVLRREAWGFAVDAGDGLWHLFSEADSGGKRYRLTAIEDRNRNRIAITYEDGRLAEITDSAGRRIKFTTTREGRITRIAAQNAVSGGRWVIFAEYIYDPQGNLVAATDADGNTCRYAYDEDHRLTADADRTGLTFHFVYDLKGRCVEAWGDYPEKEDLSLDKDLPKFLADGTTRAKGIHHCVFSYDIDGTSEVVDSTQVRRFFGNAHGLVDKRVEGGGVTSNEYNDQGHLIAVTDVLQGRTSYTRDARGRIVQVVDPLGRVTRIERDAAGLPVTMVDPAGGVTTWSRDAHGNPLVMKDAAGGVTALRYDGRGQLTELVDATGAKTSITYDEQGNVATITQPNGGVWRYSHDAFGRRTQVVDPLGSTLRHAFSERGLLVAVYDAVGGTRRFGYDGEGHLVWEQTPKGSVKEYTFGGYHKLCAIKDANGHTTRLLYNREGELVRVVNPKGEEHHFFVNPNGRLIGEKTFDGRTIRYKNDAFGRAVKIENGAREKTELVYGKGGELLSKTYADGSAETFEYDLLGNIIAAAGPAGAFRFERDAIGRIIRETQQIGDVEHTIEVEYDGVGQRRRRRTSLGHVEEIERDAFGARRRTVLDSSFEVLHTSDLLGREIDRSLPGGGRIGSAYDADGRLGRRRAIATAAVPRSRRRDEPAWLGEREAGITVDRTYRYDWDGDLIEAIDGQRGGTEYQYDPVGQLVAMVPPKARGIAFRYDAAGNVYENVEAARAYEKGRLIQKGSASYRWDDDGRLIEKRVLDPSTGREASFLYAWDAAGQLSRVETPGGEIIDFAYDPFARRVQKKVAKRIPGEKPVPISLTRFVWDGERIVHEIKQSARRGGDPVVEERTYCFEDESFEPSAQRSMDQDDVASGSGWFSYLNDPTGAPDRLIAPDGQVACELRRDALGRAEITEGARTTTPLNLLGQYADAETGLAYNRFRYYDPDAGRFISADPMGLLGGFHPYTYAPSIQTWVDPLGLKPLKPVVLGETMSTRVCPVASAMGAHTFSPRSRFKPEIDGQDACNKAWEKNQRRWMRDQIASGRDIYDIGEDPTRPKRSEYCRMEHEELIKAGYKRECTGKTVEADVGGTKQTFPLYKWVKK